MLQGGGALGSYQAGVVEGLLEAGIEPDWVAGISIGALNSAIIAGNAPEHRLSRLQGFWGNHLQPTSGLSLGALPSNPLAQSLHTPVSKVRSALEASLTLAMGKTAFSTHAAFHPGWGWTNLSPKSASTTPRY